MGMEWRRGSMSAWLLKKKSGSSMVRMRQYNKRFFTIDFDSRVFFYSHAEGSKKVSTVIHFVDITDVQQPDPHDGKRNSTTSAEGVPLDPSASTSSKRGSRFGRSFSFSSNTTKGVTVEEQAHHYVTLTVRPGKAMELLCSTHDEAEQWHQAFKEAMLCGRENAPCGNATSLSSFNDDEDEAEAAAAFRTVELAPPASSSSPSHARGRTPERVPTGAVAAAAMAAATAAVAAPTSAAAAAAAAGADKPAQPPRPAPVARAAAEAPVPFSATGGYPARETPAAASSAYAPAAPPVAPVPTAAAAAEPVAAAPVSVASDAQSPGAAADDGDDAAPPPKKGTFLDFSVEAAEPEELPGHGQATPAGSAVAAVGDAQEDIVETACMQSADFGFEGDEDTESSGSAVSTPREGATNTFAGLSPAGGSPTASAPPADVKSEAAAKPVAGSYGDRQAGMTMQERMANMEFSDDEEDYDPDDPLGLKQK